MSEIHQGQDGDDPGAAVGRRDFFRTLPRNIALGAMAAAAGFLVGKRAKAIAAEQAAVLEGERLIVEKAEFVREKLEPDDREVVVQSDDPAGFAFDAHVNYPYLSGSAILFIGFLLALVLITPLKTESPGEGVETAKMDVV